MNMPEFTEKIMFEGAGEGHGFAAYPYGEVQEYALNWLKYQVLGDQIACNNLLDIPSIASQYLTNIVCSEDIAGDVNGDQMLDILDIVFMINMVLSNEYDFIADVNEDGVVNILDVILMVNILVGGLP